MSKPHIFFHIVVHSMLEDIVMVEYEPAASDMVFAQP